MSTLQCPVDLVTVNEYKARVNAFFVLGLTVTYLLTGVWVIFAVLAIDFLLRTGNGAKYSPIGFLSDAVIRTFKIGHKPTDRGPKRFAASVGLVFSIGILALTTLHLTPAANVLAGVIAVFAVLESFVGFCAGCYVYTFGQLLLKKKA